MNLKLNCFFLVLIFFFSLSLSAEKKPENFVDRSLFTRSVSSALLQDKAELLIGVTAPFYKEKESSGIPNCFPCSLYLIRSTMQSDSKVQLVAADLAVKFSPDLPEAHLHYLSRLIKFTPFSFDRLSKEFTATFISFFNFPSRDAFFYYIFNSLIKGGILFIVFYFIILFLKYSDLVAHKYMHLVGFSKFYAVSIMMVLAFSAWILLSDDNNWLLAILTLLVFFSSFLLIRENLVLQLVFVLCLCAQGGNILMGTGGDVVADKSLALNNLNAIFSPDSASIDQIDTNVPGGSMAKGYLFYYSGNHKRAVFHFRKELATINDGEIKASLENVLGLSYAAMGNYKEAIKSLENSYNSSKKINTGYNLSKVMYEGGFGEKGAALERNILEKAGTVTLSYANLDLPEMYKVWHFVTSGRTNTRLETWVRFFVFLSGYLFFFIFLILIEINYLNNLKITLCLECGSVICSKCNGGGEHVCAVCKLMKVAPNVFKAGEKELYESRRERFFARQSIIGSAINFLIPGSGLIYSNRILEGSFYLFTIVMILTQLGQNEMGLIYNIETGGLENIRFIALAAAIVFYLISIVRGYIVSKGD